MLNVLSFGIGFGTGVVVGGTAGVLIGRQWERNEAFIDYLAAEEGGEYDEDASEVSLSAAANAARSRLHQKAKNARRGRLAKLCFANKVTLASVTTTTKGKTAEANK